MALPLYLAKTAEEMTGNSLPDRLAYMACHFSPGGKGLSNLPCRIPEGAMLILDDSTPMDGHDPEWISRQLCEVIKNHQCESVLLDFQRQHIPGQLELARELAERLPCPVGVSELYAGGLSCPVFLSPVPPDKPVFEYLSTWQGREIWLEAALDGILLNLTESGCTDEPLFVFPEDGLTDERLHCHYTVEANTASATFRLWRTREDLDALLAEAKSRGITKAIGLWQELAR